MGRPVLPPGGLHSRRIKVAEGLPTRLGFGKFETDGNYIATSFRPGDGLVPGQYRVGVACFDPSMLSIAPGDHEYQRASYVKEGFQPQELVVEPGSGSVEYNVDVPLRNPSGRKK